MLRHKLILGFAFFKTLHLTAGILVIRDFPHPDLVASCNEHSDYYRMVQNDMVRTIGNIIQYSINQNPKAKMFRYDPSDQTLDDGHSVYAFSDSRKAKPFASCFSPHFPKPYNVEDHAAVLTKVAQCLKVAVCEDDSETANVVIKDEVERFKSDKFLERQGAYEKLIGFCKKADNRHQVEALIAMYHSERLALNRHERRDRSEIRGRLEGVILACQNHWRQMGATSKSEEPSAHQTRDPKENKDNKTHVKRLKD